MSTDLREAREKKGYTVEEVSEILKIRKQYIISLEEENYENLPGKIYVKGYSKIYREFLGLELPDTDNDDTVNIDDLKNDNININEKKTKKTVTVVICTILFILVMISYYIFQNYDFGQNNLISNGIIHEDGNDEAELDQSY